MGTGIVFLLFYRRRPLAWEYDEVFLRLILREFPKCLFLCNIRVASWRYGHWSRTHLICMIHFILLLRLIVIRVRIMLIEMIFRFIYKRFLGKISLMLLCDGCAVAFRFYLRGTIHLITLWSTIWCEFTATAAVSSIFIAVTVVNIEWITGELSQVCSHQIGIISHIFQCPLRISCW